MESMNLENFKAEVHRTLLSKLDLEKLSRINSSQARQAVSSIINEIISDRRVPLSFDEQEKIQTDLLDEVFGLGPLEPLLKDQKISDIMVNDKDHVFIEKGGLLTRADCSFRDDRVRVGHGQAAPRGPSRQSALFATGPGMIASAMEEFDSLITTARKRARVGVLCACIICVVE